MFLFIHTGEYHLYDFHLMNEFFIIVFTFEVLPTYTNIILIIHFIINYIACIVTRCIYIIHRAVARAINKARDAVLHPLIQYVYSKDIHSMK